MITTWLSESTCVPIFFSVVVIKNVCKLLSHVQIFSFCVCVSVGILYHNITSNYIEATSIILIKAMNFILFHFCALWKVNWCLTVSYISHLTSINVFLRSTSLSLSLSFSLICPRSTMNVFMGNIKKYIGSNVATD